MESRDLDAVLAAHPGDAEEVVSADLDAAARAPVDADHLDAALAALELTTLEPTDGPARVRALAERALRPDPEDAAAPTVAGVCTWPDLVGEVAQALAGTPVAAVSVAGAFPHARTTDAVAAAEVAHARQAGAAEVDVVLDRGALRTAGAPAAAARLGRLREAAGEGVLKVILETGALADAHEIRRAAWTAVLAGADAIKTSTGTVTPAATLPATRLLLEVARDAEAGLGRRVAVKPAGGIRTAAHAASLVVLARRVRGHAGAEPPRLRIGASSLVDALVTARAR